MAKTTAQTDAVSPTALDAQPDHLVLFDRVPAAGFGRVPGTDYRSLVPLRWILSVGTAFRSVRDASVTCCGRGAIRTSWHELRCSLPSPRLLFPSYRYRSSPYTAQLSPQRFLPVPRSPLCSAACGGRHAMFACSRPKKPALSE